LKLNLFGHICRKKDNKAGEADDVWNDGWTDEEKKTV